MNIVFKAVIAFGIGAGALAGVQSLGLHSLKQYLNSEAAKRPVVTNMKPAFSFDNSKIGAVIYKPPKIDTSFGERAALGQINQQINQSIRALDSVPRPRTTIPGMRY